MESDENFTGSCKNTIVAELDKHWGCPKVPGTLNGGSPGHFQKKCLEQYLLSSLLQA